MMCSENCSTHVVIFIQFCKREISKMICFVLSLTFVTLAVVIEGK